MDSVGLRCVFCSAMCLIAFLHCRIRDTLISFIRAAFHDQVGTPYIVALLPEVLAARDDSDKVLLSTLFLSLSSE